MGLTPGDAWRITPAEFWSLYDKKYEEVMALKNGGDMPCSGAEFAELRQELGL